MIPRRIRLRNFLSYRDCTVDLRGLQLAVLSGRNGEGKSALLDAMTWALWGEARGRLEDDRIHLAEQEMLVDFEFEASGDVFEVVRKRTRGRASGALDFFQLGSDGAKTALTGGTMSETEAEIVRRVRMDYDTFANSAFVAQGRANEFTRRTPRERKEIFRKVLGLERYEELSTRAAEQRKDSAQRLKDLEANLGEAWREVEKLPEVAKQLEDAIAERMASQSVLAEADARLAALRQAAGDYARLQREAEEANRRVDEAWTAIAACERVIGGLEDELCAVAKALEGRDRTLAGYERLQSLRTTEEDLAQRQAIARRCEEALNAALTAIAEERARLQSGAEALRREVETGEATVAQLPALREQEDISRSEREALRLLEQQVEAERGAEKQLAERAAGCRSEAAQLKEQAQKIKEREAQLDEGAAVCPVCQQPLAPGQVDHVRGEYANQRSTLGDRYRESIAAAEQAERDGEALRTTLSTLQVEHRRRNEALQASSRELHTRLSVAREAEDALPARRKALEEAECLLRSDTYAPEARARAAQARKELDAAGYDADRHANVREELRQLASAEQAYAALGRAEEKQSSLENSIAREQEALEERRRTLTSCEKALATAADALEQAEDVGPRLSEAESELAGLREHDSELTRREGALEQEERTLVTLTARVEAALDHSKSLREEEQVFGDLAKAFGRDGVQAMLIDKSLPRLQHVANAMLDRMTGGRIHVSLHTQRENARGGIVETLDIRISDDLGTRDYEMYSGGEAFRVDFALRIALARLLAERSGAELPTLIIDEGFGSQDQEGIDRLVEAITAISGDFRLILVVTHIDEMRERFERRIEVTKDPQRGSVARVV